MKKLTVILSKVKSRALATVLLTCSFLLIKFQYRQGVNKSLKKVEASKTCDEYFLQCLRYTAKWGRSGTLFRLYSLPVFSGPNTWAESTYDAAYTKSWSVGKERDLRKLSTPGKLIYFAANVAKQRGFFSLSWSLLNLLEEKGAGEKYFGYLGQLDICLLFLCWSQQLDFFYEKNIWFNPDEEDTFQDDMSWFFKNCNDEKLSDIAKKLREIRPDSSVYEQMIGEYYERIFDLDKARTHYRLACAFNPNDLYARVKLRNIEKIFTTKLENEDVLRVIAASDFSKKYKLEEKAYLPSGDLDYKYKIILKGQEAIRNVRLKFSPSHLIKLNQVSNLGGGVLVIEEDDKQFLLEDSKHLDFRHLKLFTPLLVMYDKEKALVVKRNKDEKVSWPSAFVIPGLGWNYYHWLLEVVPQLAVYEKSGLKGKVPLAFQFTLKKWHMETLELLGFSDVEILPYIPDLFTSYDNAYVSLSSSRDLVPSPASIKYLRDNLAKPKSSLKDKKLYLTRKGVNAVRKSDGLKRIEDILLSNGFEFVDPSSMSISQQIDLFSDVGTIVAEGGAALANLIFCPEKTKVIILAGDRAWAETFTVIAAVVGLELSVFFSSCRPNPNPYYMWTAFDCELSEKIFEQELNKWAS